MTDGAFRTVISLMALYSGSALCHLGICIGAPQVAFDFDHLFDHLGQVDGVPQAPYWYERAKTDAGMAYFWVFRDDTPIGAFFLHDTADDDEEALIGYHLFSSRDRGQGIGRIALQLLVDYAIQSTGIRQLVIITSKDNVASQRIAQVCGFTYAGGSREDPENTHVYTLALRSAS